MPWRATSLHVIDGQQRLTTLTLLLAAAYSVLKEHVEELDKDTRTDVTNLGRHLVRKSDKQPRVTPQRQGYNLDDYRAVLEEAGLPIEGERKPYYASRRVRKCYRYFRSAIERLAESDGITQPEAALRVHEAATRAVLVKIEVASHADAFVLFESLNNRGMPLSSVDLIKNPLLAESQKKQIMEVDEAFQRWNEVLTSLGDNYAIQERFLRHFYNAFKSELPDVRDASVATKSRLIRIDETLLEHDLKRVVNALVEASEIYGRINTSSVSMPGLDLAQPYDRVVITVDDPVVALMELNDLKTGAVHIHAGRDRHAAAALNEATRAARNARTVTSGVSASSCSIVHSRAPPS